MSGLEVVVRPAVLPNIRPLAPRVLAPEDDPAQGIFTLGGSGGRLIDVPLQFHSSVKREGPHYETERTYDLDRIKQRNPDGTVNDDNYVDVERMTKLKTYDPYKQMRQTTVFINPPESPNIETIDSNLTRGGYTFQDQPPVVPVNP